MRCVWRDGHMSLLDTLRQTTKGGFVIADWLGSGGRPVLQRKADDRAMCCVFGNEGKPCPHNKAPHWWEKTKGSIADAIKDMLAIKNQLELKAAHEDDAHMCDRCGCCLKLKVWVPIEHVRKVLDEKTVAELPPYCWMRNELMAEKI